jgi:DNA-binding MarR family transcriptional regulator
MTPVHERWIDELFAGLSRTEMAQLLELLGKLKSSLQRERASVQEDGS